MSHPSVILVDMDNVLADLDGQFLRIWKERYPAVPAPELEEREHHWIGHHFAVEHDASVRALVREPGFLRGLPPIPGAIEAIRQMTENGFDVLVCTAPFSHHSTCLQEKQDWINQHFDEEFVNRLIVTRDKTLIAGDILIDDAPEIQGRRKPLWKYILFDAPYNQKNNGIPRLDWINWREVLSQV